jgi:glyoxylase-like metal-dependent hydrolase (beta-lactamase superfamily II)/ferredoxin
MADNSESMAQVALRRSENAPGDLFVDSSCIDCDTCRWMAPATFGRVGRQSAVSHQPATPEDRRAALHALVSCPTASIGTEAKAPDLVQAVSDFPLPIAPGVFHCGYHSESSFGAASYFVAHPDGNVLIDCPRFAAPLVKRLEALGGVKWMLLTHRDDVADHDKFAKHFGLTRVMHRRDAPVHGGPMERFLEGDDPVELLPGFTAIPTPGHTAGHMCFHLRSPTGNILFTGDHLAYDDEAGRLEAWPDVCWHDWGEQTASMRRLADWEFDWVLPGHGRRGHLPAANMRTEVLRLVDWMKTQ